MSCCGGQREQLRSATPGRQARGPKAGMGRVLFEYTGPTGVVVKGGVTGRGYGFRGYGSRVAVDSRDARSLAGTPFLQRVLR